MIALKVNFDPDSAFARQLTELERSQIPFATMQTVNLIAFDIRQQWADIAPKVFQSPTALTTKAALYKKASKANPVAEIFIRDEAFKGTPPSKYLQAQVFGGQRATKGIERLLGAKGFLPSGWFVVPGKGAKLDSHGNIPRSQINAIKSQLKINFDPLTDETNVSRERRVKRETKKGERRGDYFAVAKPRGGLKPGVYQRIKSGLGRGTSSILHFVQRASYRKRYDIFQMAQTVFARRSPEIFRQQLQKAVDATFKKKFGL